MAKNNKFNNTRRKISMADMVKELQTSNILDNATSNLTKRCKFNFSYFDDSQSHGQKFSEWTHEALIDLLDDLKSFSMSPLSGWPPPHFVIYGAFPTDSYFTKPTYIPEDVSWARFKLNNLKRLIGFVVSEHHHKTLHLGTEEYFDKNTFYVVFLDENHHFYPVETK
ncbi:hypothetical protein [Sulfurospirillum sp.]|uniref:hypothetical protein n=1 Tax=Sulfurospirillum sp. TaxID=2053622 RepID=UPI002FDE9861